MPKVLLVDDDLTMVSLLKTLLSLDGYQVETMIDRPGDVIAAIRSSNPEAILMDIYLGDRNGLDLLREIRAQPEFKDIKVIMTSGIDKSHECLAAGANAFLLKPYMPDELLTSLHS